MATEKGKETTFGILLQEIKARIIRISISIAVGIFICMTMNITFINYQGMRIPLIDINPYHSISIQIISFMRDTLLPKNVFLIQIAPGQAFTAQILISITIGITISTPIILREIFAFITPALYHNERANISHFFLPSLILFICGITFSYFIFLPHTIEFLYAYGNSIGVTAFFDINQFIVFTIQFLSLFGISFQLPLIMFLLTKLQIVNSTFWKNSFRYIFLIIIIIGAFITPDGSGISMWFISAPLIFLYLIGMVIIKEKFKVTDTDVKKFGL